MYSLSIIARYLAAALIVVGAGCQDNSFTGPSDKKAETARPVSPILTQPKGHPAPHDQPKEDPKVGDDADCSGLSADACHKLKKDDDKTGSYRVVVCSDPKSDQCQGRINQAKDQDKTEGSKIVVVNCDPKDPDAKKAATCADTVQGKLNDLADQSTGTTSTDSGKLDSGTDTATASSGQLETEEGKVCKSNSTGYGGKVYRLPPQTQSLPDLKSMTPIGQTDAPTLDVPPRSWTAGFPGVPDLIEWFAIRFYASLDVPAAGDYAFATLSDDGSKVYVDGKQVIDNDGIHGPTRRESSGTTLTKGPHKLVVEWFQGPRIKIALRVFWKRPGSDWEIIPAQFLNHDKLCDLTELGTFD